MPWKSLAGVRLPAAVAALLLLAAGVAGGARAQAAIEELYIPAMVVTESNFRTDASTKQPPLDTFQAGKQVLITGVTQDTQGRDWYRVRVYDDGREGFIFGELLRPLPDFPTPPNGLGVTKVLDAGERDRLVGKHGLTLQWIGVEPKGEIVAYENLGLLYLWGWQDGFGNAAGDSIDIDGWITEVGANYFRLKGKVVYRVAALTGDKTCGREGDFLFSRAAGRDYWRLEPFTKPCGDWDQYIDVYLR